LNQFDSALALHLDVREVLRQQLDDRLLPFVIRRAPAVPESLAEGMTVVDYAPDSPVAEDYRNLASWLRSRSAPASTESKPARWSER
jgi:cellulose biosynthesis protein BcsQ